MPRAERRRYQPTGCHCANRGGGQKDGSKTEAAVALAMRRPLDHDAQAGSLFAASGRDRNRDLPARSLPMTSAFCALPPDMAVNTGLLPTPEFRQRSGSFGPWIPPFS